MRGSIHSERCLSANRFGDGFDCICGATIDTDPDAEPDLSGPASSLLQPLGPRDEGVILLAKIDSIPRRHATWLYWFRMACNVALDSECGEAKCGAVLVGSSAFDPQRGTYRLFEHSMLSVGFNGPPGGKNALRRCGRTQPSKLHPRADRTCCVHAEARAILSAPRDRLVGSKLYFARVDGAGNLKPSGRPYCVSCSKLAVEVGVSTWVLWHEDGPHEYGAERYHELSLRYDELMEEEEEEQRAEGRGQRAPEAEGRQTGDGSAVGVDEWTLGGGSS